jgi:hypothetical protein
LIRGLELLASWYADSASLQLGGPVRNRDLDLTTLTDVSPRRAVLAADKALDAVVDIQATLRRELVLANLCTGLDSEDYTCPPAAGGRFLRPPRGGWR